MDSIDSFGKTREVLVIDVNVEQANEQNKINKIIAIVSGKGGSSIPKIFGVNTMKAVGEVL